MKISYFVIILSLVVATAGIQYSADATSVKSPFLKLKGNWKGKGDVRPPEGKSERVSCRVKYIVPGRGNNVTQNITCAGSGYWIKATSKFKYVPGSQTISGTWSASYGDKSNPNKKETTGKVSGRLIDDVISVDLDSNDYTGSMTISLTGGKQEVAIHNLAKLVLTR